IGNLSDRFGRRPVLILSLVMLGVDYLITGLAPTIAWLFIGRILSGGAGAAYPTANAYIADISPPEKRAANFGLVGAAFGVGFVLGPALGGFVGEHFGLRAPFFTAAGLSFANALFGLVVLKESLPVERRRRFELWRANPLGALKALNHFPQLALLLAVLVLVQLAHDSLPSTWSYYTMLKFGLGTGRRRLVAGGDRSPERFFLCRAAGAGCVAHRRAWRGLYGVCLRDRGVSGVCARGKSVAVLCLDDPVHFERRRRPGAQRHHVPQRAPHRARRIARRDIKRHQPDIRGGNVGDADLVRLVHRQRRADLFSGRGLFRGGDLPVGSVAAVRAGQAGRD
ncbi:MAG TPA: MFS transporter, partial [Rhizomicrobium sp.]|nr:MFS transporter [Rhizomicrobium sp.]